MKLLLKTKDSLREFYWVDFAKDKVLGWYCSDYIRNQLQLTEDQSLEAHFHYPKDGNLHNTYILREKEKKSEEFVQIFHDKVKIKKIVNGTRLVLEETRGEFRKRNSALIEIFVPEFKLPALSDVSFHQFPTSGLNICYGSFGTVNHCRVVSQKDIKECDIVVDISEIKSSFLNIGAYLSNNRCSAAMNEADRNKKSFLKRITIQQDLFLELRCEIY